MNTWFLVLCQNEGYFLVSNGWCQWHAQLGFEHWTTLIQKGWEVLMKTKGIQAISVLNGKNLPPPACFRVKQTSLALF